MSQPKLAIEYFDIQGRAEVARAILWINDVEFEDIRVSRPDFAAKKAAGAYPRGQLPVLHVDGEVIPQSSAIIRYLANITKFQPTDPLLALRVDAYNESINDLVLAIAATFYMTPEDSKARREKLVAENIPNFLAYFEKEVQGKKYLVDERLTTADLSLLIVIKNWILAGILDHIPVTLLDAHPGLVAYFAALEETPEIKKYRAATAAATAKKTE